MEENHKSMAGELARYNLRSDSDEDSGMSGLSLSTDTSMRSHLHAISVSMLGPKGPLSTIERTEERQHANELSKFNLE